MTFRVKGYVNECAIISLFDASRAQRTQNAVTMLDQNLRQPNAESMLNQSVYDMGAKMGCQPNVVSMLDQRRRADTPFLHRTDTQRYVRPQYGTRP